MLGDSSTVLGSSSGDAAPAAAAAATEASIAAAANTLDGCGVGTDVGGGGSNSGEEDRNNRGGVGGGEEGDRSLGGNRWPRQETLALLQIRSDMDVAFRDASVKGPLWEEVSRKLAELGYHRSAKKCKEKFENVYKYHKRTKDGRTGKSDGKTYRFFDQLEALENQPSSSSSFPLSPTSQQQQHHKATHNQQKPTSMAVVSSTMTMPGGGDSGGVAANVVVSGHQSQNNNNSTVPSTTTHSLIPTATASAATPTINLTFSSFPPTNPTSLSLPPPPPLPPPPVVVVQPSSTAATSTTPTNPTAIPHSSFHSISADLYSTSSSTSSDEDVAMLEGRRKRKRKWKDFFERLMKEVIQKQEDLQKKFLEAIEKREHDRAVREEAWRMQEMARINREREILAQERSISAAKDAAVMAFLQKMSDQQNPNNSGHNQQQAQNINLSPPPPHPQPPPSQPPQLVQPVSVQPIQSSPAASAAPPPTQPAAPVMAVAVTVAPPPVAAQSQRPQQPVGAANTEIVAKADNNGENFMGTSSSRWPKTEVQALIKLRTSLDAKYLESGPKGPLWEEISSAMRKIGYSRSAKRCKEKWENINKYFKKVKEGNKKRPEDSKTCPYFHQLDALYRERNKFENSPNQIKPGNNIPLMVRPEQQWPPQQDPNHPDSGMEDMESDPMDANPDDDDKDGDEVDEDDEGGNYELVANRPPASVSAAE